jgi:hypothetical protein
MDSPATNTPTPDPTVLTTEALERGLASQAQLVAMSERRQDDLRESESNHIKEIVRLRAQYDNELRVSESARIDAIRAVDQGNVTATAKVQAEQAIALAKQVVDVAEAMRTTVEGERVSRAMALDAETAPIKKDVSEIRKVQYEEAGGKALTSENREDRIAKHGGLLVFIGIAAVLSTVVIGATAIGVTLIIHGFAIPILLKSSRLKRLKQQLLIRA